MQFLVHVDVALHRTFNFTDMLAPSVALLGTPYPYKSAQTAT
jgi:hypothetical protein